MVLIFRFEARFLEFRFLASGGDVLELLWLRWNTRGVSRRESARRRRVVRKEVRMWGIDRT